MKLTYHLAPHIRSTVSNRTVMGDAVITLLAIYIMSAFYYGERALWLCGISVATCTVADMLCYLLRHKKPNVLDYSAMVTGLIIPLLMPASVDYRIVITAGLFAICVVKQPFGGVGSNLFNPAAGGLAFAIVCWSAELFAYPAPFTALPAIGEMTATLYSGSAYTLYVGGIPQTGLSNLALGLAPGPMGATNLLVVGACLLYLVLRRTVRIQQPLCMLAAVALVAWLFPRVDATAVESVVYELVAMPTLFVTAFMFSDPVTTPSRGSAKAAYAFVSGLVLMIFRYTGGYEITAPFAILAMNALTPVFDKVAEISNTRIRRAALETISSTEQPGFTEVEEED